MFNTDEFPRPEPSYLPQILVRPLRSKLDPTKFVRVETIDFVPGAIIERAGKRYQLQKDGSQRRI